MPIARVAPVVCKCQLLIASNCSCVCAALSAPRLGRSLVIGRAHAPRSPANPLAGRTQGLEEGRRASERERKQAKQQQHEKQRPRWRWNQLISHSSRTRAARPRDGRRLTRSLRVAAQIFHFFPFALSLYLAGRSPANFLTFQARPPARRPTTASAWLDATRTSLFMAGRLGAQVGDLASRQAGQRSKQSRAEWTGHLHMAPSLFRRRGGFVWKGERRKKSMANLALV